MENEKDNLDEKLKKLSQYSRFSNERYAIPEIVNFLKDLKKSGDYDKKTIDDALARLERLETRVTNTAKQPVNEIIEDVKKQLKKAYAKIAYQALANYSETEEGKQAINDFLTRNEDLFKVPLQKAMTGKKGVFSKVKKYLLTAAGIEFLVVVAIVSYGVLYVANRTPAGKFVVDEKKTEGIRNDLASYKKETKKRLESMTNDISSYKSEIENMKKDYEQSLKSKFEGYEKTISELNEKLESSKKDYDALKKSSEDNAKKIDDLQKSNEDLDGRMREHETDMRIRDRWYDKLNPLKQ